MAPSMVARLAVARERGDAFDPDLEAALSAWWARGREAMPAVALAKEDAIARLAERDDLSDDAALEGEAGLELFLAAALAARAAGADAAFEARYLAPLGKKLGGVRLDDAGLDEAKQRARAKLLVAEPGVRAKVDGYAGKGRLAGLVRVVVTREAISVARARRREVSAEDRTESMGHRAADWDPGIESLQGRAREAFREAFARAATERLTSRERNLLRLHLLGGVTLERLAAMHGVHRATVVRWLADARATLLSETKKGMGAAMGIRGAELDSLLRGVESRLDASVERVLASVARDPEEME